MSNPIHWRLIDSVYELELCAEPCNEIGTTMLEALERFVDSIEPDKAHALIIYSSQRKGFCAGADLRELYHKLIGHQKNKNKNQIKQL